MTHTEDALIASIPPRLNPPPTSVLVIAKRELQDNLSIEHNGQYLLWQMGRYNRANLDDVMRATNRKLKQQGRAQILLNENWRVP